MLKNTIRCLGKRNNVLAIVDCNDIQIKNLIKHGLI